MYLSALGTLRRSGVQDLRESTAEFGDDCLISGFWGGILCSKMGLSNGTVFVGVDSADFSIDLLLGFSRCWGSRLHRREGEEWKVDLNIVVVVLVVHKRSQRKWPFGGFNGRIWGAYMQCTRLTPNLEKKRNIYDSVQSNMSLFSTKKK